MIRELPRGNSDRTKRIFADSPSLTGDDQHQDGREHGNSGSSAAQHTYPPLQTRKGVEARDQKVEDLYGSNGRPKNKGAKNRAWVLRIRVLPR